MTKRKPARNLRSSLNVDDDGKFIWDDTVTLVTGTIVVKRGRQKSHMMFTTLEGLQKLVDQLTRAKR